MDKLIVYLFGINRMNLLGWVTAGLLVLGVAAYLVVGAVSPPFAVGLPPVNALLVAISLLLMGIFGLLLQIYCSLLASRLEAPPRTQAPEAAPPPTQDTHIRPPA